MFTPNLPDLQRYVKDLQRSSALRVIDQLFLWWQIDMSYWIIHGRMASMDGPIKTFPLRVIKDAPPHLHDGRLLTLDDTVEFFNMSMDWKLLAEEQSDLVAFLHSL